MSTEPTSEPMDEEAKAMAVALEGMPDWRRMPFDEAVALAREVMALEH